jgi:hypothetical protein
VAELEEADLVLLNKNLLLMAKVLAFQQTERVEARSANQGIIIEVQTQILDGCCRRLLNPSLCPLQMRTEHCVHPAEV